MKIHRLPLRFCLKYKFLEEVEWLKTKFLAPKEVDYDRGEEKEPLKYTANKTLHSTWSNAINSINAIALVVLTENRTSVQMLLINILLTIFIKQKSFSHFALIHSEKRF